MYEEKFSKWAKWEDRDSLDDITCPGVYVIARSDKKPSSDFEWLEQIIYIGMTNSAGGLKARLKQFDNTIRGKTGHGGADRVRHQYPHYEPLVKALYVSVAPFVCDVKTNQPKDLIVMGTVAKFEYDCFAEFVKKHRSLPEFNKKSSKKYSRHGGKIDPT